MKRNELANERLTGQLEFLAEIDRLKTVLRKTYLIDRSRLENSAEHSWHVAIWAILMLEHANDPKPDLDRVVRLLLLHDLVEIDAGDTFAYDTAGYKDKEAREQAAADRLFGLLPKDQRDEWMGLWREFEDGVTAEAIYAAALDRLQPVFHNYRTGGASWKQNRIARSQVLVRLEPVREASDALWALAQDLIRRSVEQGILLDDQAEESEG